MAIHTNGQVTSKAVASMSAAAMMNLNPTSTISSRTHIKLIKAQPAILQGNADKGVYKVWPCYAGFRL
uniref:Uncharacterized protein n=1 Tax=Oryza nivara TaxID=4536 RepID=A0A0E0I4E7_ORYNI